MKVLLTVLLGAGILIFHFSLKKPFDKEEVREVIKDQKMAELWLHKLPPDFQLNLLNNETFHLAETIGKKIIILNFFTTWCGPCKSEMGEFVRFQEEHSDKDLLFILISVREDSERVENFLKSNHISIPAGVDLKGEIAKLYNVKSFPTTIYISRSGAVKLYEVGAIPNADVAFLNLLKADLKIEIELIDRVRYEKIYMEQGHPAKTLIAEHPRQRKSKRDSRSISVRIKCPNCDVALEKCSCETGKKIMEELSKIPSEGKNDGDILKELFLLPEAER